MARLHVFMNQEGKVVATGPAPEDPQARRGEGPVYAGFSPARDAEGFRAFEIEVDDEAMLVQRDMNVREFHSRIGDLVRSRKDVKQVEFRR